MDLSIRKRPLCVTLMICLLAFSACDLGPHRDDPITARTYQCHGADPNYGYSACDREPPR
jgi:hypothetical protein